VGTLLPTLGVQKLNHPARWDLLGKIAGLVQRVKIVARVTQLRKDDQLGLSGLGQELFQTREGLVCPAQYRLALDKSNFHNYSCPKNL
jgi:hypothetical protein